MGRLPTEFVSIINGDVLQNNAIRTYSDILPLGREGWHKLRLTFCHTLGAGGTVPNVLGSYRFIKNIVLRTNRNENIINMPGMALYYLNWIFNGVEPTYTNVIAGAGAFEATIDIPFIFPFLSRSEDLIIDTGRYRSMELEIHTGTGADFQRTAPPTVATEIDISVMRSKSAFSSAGKPHFLPFLKHVAPFQAVTRGYHDVEVADDLALFGFLAVANDLVTWGAIGNAYDGTPIDCLDLISFQDNVQAWVRNLVREVFVEERAHYSNNRAFTGVYPYFLTREGSYRNAYWTGEKSELRFVIGNGNVGTPTTPQVDLILIGMRDMR